MHCHSTNYRVCGKYHFWRYPKKNRTNFNTCRRKFAILYYLWGNFIALYMRISYLEKLFFLHIFYTKIKYTHFNLYSREIRDVISPSWGGQLPPPRGVLPSPSKFLPDPQNFDKTILENLNIAELNQKCDRL